MTDAPDAVWTVRDVIAAHYLCWDADTSPEWAKNFLQENRSAEHKGDCPHAVHKGPITCHRCCADEAYGRADALQAALVIARAATAVKEAERLARLMCKHEGTAQCAAICLSHSATFTRDGQCPEAMRVYGYKAKKIVGELGCANA